MGRLGNLLDFNGSTNHHMHRHPVWNGCPANKKKKKQNGNSNKDYDGSHLDEKKCLIRA
jgi:hypothetical protein